MPKRKILDQNGLNFLDGSMFLRDKDTEIL